jgi:hypothetical protein
MIDAWVPAEDVRSIHQYVQRDLLAEGAWKIQPRTFRVAQLDWQERLHPGGDRLSWSELLER